LVESVLREDYSPAQVVGWFARIDILTIRHETIYRHIWQDKKAGGTLHVHLRQANKRFRKRYGAYDSRGRFAGKRRISTRQAGATNRSRIGHWEVHTMLGNSQGGACIVTLVERKTGYVVMGKLVRRAAANLRARLECLVRRQPHAVRTITADNGTEFHRYKALEARVPLKFYFATPYHSWERGSNENMNGLIRQYLPNGVSMERLTQADGDRIADKLNHRPRKRFDWQTPEELYATQRCSLHFKVDFRQSARDADPFNARAQGDKQSLSRQRAHWSTPSNRLVNAHLHHSEHSQTPYQNGMRIPVPTSGRGRHALCGGQDASIKKDRGDQSSVAPRLCETPTLARDERAPPTPSSESGR